jgi:hypothetical protein
MKTSQQIELEIAAASRLPKIDDYPAIQELWNEYEIMWRMDNGRGYQHILSHPQSKYHLLYFDRQLVIVEREGVTIFSHLTNRIDRVLGNPLPHNPDFDSPHHIITIEELVKKNLTTQQQTTSAKSGCVTLEQLLKLRDNLVRQQKLVILP